jgi:DNA replication and repair protein RecF
MGLDRLEVRDFRCIQAAAFEPHPETNLIVGGNGSGKTTLLEAIHVLGTGRSFRVRELGPLVRRGAEVFSLSGQLSPLGQIIRATGGGMGLELTVNGQSLRGTAELASLLPVQALHPEMHALIEGPPEGRRRFLDWGAFHVKQSYLPEWRRYHRTLRQRNAALKEATSRRELEAWDAELVRFGTAIHRDREDYVASLLDRFGALSSTLLGLPSGLRYQRGWPDGQTLDEALQRSAERERVLRTTQVGPHRGDLEVTLGAAPARHAASRGQQKLLALSLGLAQAQIVAAVSPRRLVLLLDDPVAEVDAEGAQRLVAEVTRVPAQRFITGLRPESYPCAPSHVFHVKQGALRQVI